MDSPWLGWFLFASPAQYTRHTGLTITSVVSSSFFILSPSPSLWLVSSASVTSHLPAGCPLASVAHRLAANQTMTLFQRTSPLGRISFRRYGFALGSQPLRIFTLASRFCFRARNATPFHGLASPLSPTPGNRMMERPSPS